MAELVRALEQLGPREARLVLRAGVEGATVPALAAEYGVPEASASTLLFRAARQLAGALGGTPCPPLPPAAEASELAAFVRGEGAAAAALARLTAEGETVRAGRAAAAAQEASSGRRRLENVLRWLAILGILAVSLWSLQR